MRENHSFIGDDCPPGYKRVGRIDIADPADVDRALDRGYRIGSVYDGYSGSCAEPCAADVYERPEASRCPECEGSGLRDSGGVHPWGEHIQVPCDCGRAALQEKEAGE